ncbi:MAG: hypothetical protein II980_04460 [Clostridia bacterium]|nr:hypothetical protein [Clostridia bacterium]
MKKSIYLYPSLEYNDEEFKSDIENKQSSLCVLYNKCFADLSEKKIWLSGEASIGKSSLLETLRIHFLKEDISYIYIDLNELNNNKKALYRLEEKIQKLGTQVTLVLDSYEELYDKNIISRIDEIIYNNCFNLDNIIVSSRDDKRITIDKKRVSIFEKYSRIKINKFTIEQVKGILKRNGMDSSLFSKSTLELLQNTMFLSTMLKINAQKGLRSAYVLAKANTEMTFLQKYFDLVFEEKNNDKEAKTHISTMGKRLYEYIVFNKYSESKVHIPIELQGIFLSRKSKKGYYIKASQLKHTYFAIATYLYETMLEPVFLPERANMLSKDNIASYLDAEFGTYIHSLTYMGEMLRTHRYATEIMALFDKQIPKKKTFLYLNVVAIFLGYNNGVLNDKEQNGVFNLGKAFIKIADKEDFFSFNPYIKLLNSKYLVSFRRCKNGVYGSTFDFKMPSSIKRIKRKAFDHIDSSLKSIDIKNVTKIGAQAFGSYRKKLKNIYASSNNTMFRSQDNCLLDKYDRLWICAGEPFVPEGTKEIKSGAFYFIENKCIYIPKSVHTIEYIGGCLEIIDGKRYYNRDCFDATGSEIGALLNPFISESQTTFNIKSALIKNGYYNKREQVSNDIEKELESQYEAEMSDEQNDSTRGFFLHAIKYVVKCKIKEKKEIESQEKALIKQMKESKALNPQSFFITKTRPYSFDDIIIFNQNVPVAVISVTAAINSLKKVIKKRKKYYGLKDILHIATNGYITKIGKISENFKKYKSAHIVQKNIIPNEKNFSSSPLGIFISSLFFANDTCEEITKKANAATGEITGIETEAIKEQNKAIELVKNSKDKNIQKIGKMFIKKRSLDQILISASFYLMNLISAFFIYKKLFEKIRYLIILYVNNLISKDVYMELAMKLIIKNTLLLMFIALLIIVFVIILTICVSAIFTITGIESKMYTNRTKKAMILQDYLYEQGIYCIVSA